MLIVLREIHIPLDRKCVRYDTKAVVYSGAVGQIVGLVAHEMKQRGADLCIAETVKDLRELAISGESLAALQEMILTPEIQVLIQAVSPEGTNLVPIRTAEHGLKTALIEAKRRSTLSLHVADAQSKGDIRRAKQLDEQRQFALGRSRYQLNKIAASIPGANLEEKLRAHIGSVIDANQKIQKKENRSLAENV